MHYTREKKIDFTVDIALFGKEKRNSLSHAEIEIQHVNGHRKLLLIAKCNKTLEKNVLETACSRRFRLYGAIKTKFICGLFNGK